MSIEHLWSTPIFRTRIDDANLIHSLASEILCDPDVSHDNACEISREKVLKRIAENDGLFSVVADHIKNAVDEFLKQAYNLVDVPYNIEPFYLLHHLGGSVRYHNHSASSLTGVLYLNVPSGNVTLIDPRVNANRGMLPAILESGHFNPVEITPTAGDLIIFPSYVYHLGSPNLSREPRIVLPFDVNPLIDD